MIFAYRGQDGPKIDEPTGWNVLLLCYFHFNLWPTFDPRKKGSLVSRFDAQTLYADVSEFLYSGKTSAES